MSRRTAKSPKPTHAPIAEGLHTLRVPIDSIQPDPANVRVHDDRNLASIKASLARYGQRKPVVVNKTTGILEAGSGTWQAAKALGWPEIAAVFVTDDPTTAAGYAIADNRTAELAAWDDAALAKTLEALRAEGELLHVGFNDDDLTRIVRDLAHEPRPTPVFDPTQSDAFSLSQRILRGQIWQLGTHRLMCGDATSPDDVARLMNGAKAELFITDPPYLVKYTGADRPVRSTRKGGGKNGSGGFTDRPTGGDHVDKNWAAVYREIPAQDAERFFRTTFASALTALTENAAWYLWHGHRWAPMIQMLWRELGLLDHQVIICKSKKIFTHAWWSWEHEPCLFGWRQGHKPKMDHRVSLEYGTVWSVNHDYGIGENEHPTQKPIELWRRPILAHVARSVLDLFAGSGTAVIAAESLPECVAYAMEIEPFFCAVSIRRWEAASGKKAERLL